jgi:hypothetical protein
VTHAALMMVFSVAVGLVLGLILRRDLRVALRLSAVIAGSMVVGATIIAWVFYLLLR